LWMLREDAQNDNVFIVMAFPPIGLLNYSIHNAAYFIPLILGFSIHEGQWLCGNILILPCMTCSFKKVSLTSNQIT